MCEWIILIKNIDDDGIELFTIQDLIDNGITNLIKSKLHKDYKIDNQSCLCQIDIEATMKKNNYEFARDYAFGYYAWQSDDENIRIKIEKEINDG